MTPPAALRDHVKTLAERIGERHGWRPEALKRANVADTLSGFADKARQQAIPAVRRRLFNLDVELPGTARADGMQPIVSSDSIATMRSPRAGGGNFIWLVGRAAGRRPAPRHAAADTPDKIMTRSPAWSTVCTARLALARERP